MFECPVCGIFIDLDKNTTYDTLKDHLSGSHNVMDWTDEDMKSLGKESKATEFDYNKWENAEDGNVLVPDEDLKEIKDLEKQLDGENVCPECGDKTDDDKEFEDHLNAHRFEEEV